MLREERPHLRLALDVRFLAGEAEALGIVEIGPGADGQQHVVRLGIFPAEVVGVVGGHHADAQLLAQPEHALGDQALLGDAVVLDLEPESVLPEQLRKPLRGGLGVLVAPGPERVGHFAREAGRQAHQALGVPGQDLLVDPGPPVEPFGVADRGEADQIAVAGLVPGQQHEVAVVRRGVGRLLRGAPVSVGQVGLEAQDGAELSGLGLGVKAPGRVQVAVVGDRQAVHPQLLDVAHQIGDPVGPVEQGVFAVGMEVDECHSLGGSPCAKRCGGRLCVTADGESRRDRSGKLPAVGTIVKTHCHALTCVMFSADSRGSNPPDENFPLRVAPLAFPAPRIWLRRGSTGPDPTMDLPTPSVACAPAAAVTQLAVASTSSWILPPPAAACACRPPAPGARGICGARVDFRGALHRRGPGTLSVARASNPGQVVATRLRAPQPRGGAGAGPTLGGPGVRRHAAAAGAGAPRAAGKLASPP